MVSVTPSSVRERINVSAAEAPDDVVNRFITAAGVTVEVETGESVGPSNCSGAEAEAIRNFAAIYCACGITGGSAQGSSFRVGDLAVNESSSTQGGLSGVNLQFLLDQTLKNHREPQGPTVQGGERLDGHCSEHLLRLCDAICTLVLRGHDGSRYEPFWNFQRLPHPNIRVEL